jgi:hypothetical protein
MRGKRFHELTINRTYKAPIILKDAADHPQYNLETLLEPAALAEIAHIAKMA